MADEEGGVGLTARVLAVLTLASTPALAADDVPLKLDSARAAYQKGDLARAARDVEAALKAMQERLGRIFAETLPTLSNRWKPDEVEIQGLGEIGGGLSITRAYTRDDQSLNASLLLDSPAGESAQALLAAPVAQQHVRKVKVGGEEAVLRFDPSTSTGEITMMVGNRVVLEVQGDNITSADPLLEAAAAWNLAKIRTLLGGI